MLTFPDRSLSRLRSNREDHHPMSLVQNPAAKLWLTQFSEKEKPIAQLLLDNFAFVSADQFQNDLSHLASTTFPVNESIAFFVEREIPNHWYAIRKPLRKKIERKRHAKSSPSNTRPKPQQLKVKRPEKMYKEILVDQGKGLRKRQTASGASLPAVRSPTNNRQQIGSEGMVASVLSKICNLSPNRYFLHPSAELIRQKRIRRFVIVTDFIGSGTRVASMLASLWFVKSVRSWFNGGLVKFSVLCYSGMEHGFKTVAKHRVRPKIHKVRTCPTIFNSFDEEERDQIIALCRSRFTEADEPLGYKETGALLAFQHSCPNNVPALFIREKKGRRKPWHPLFPARTSVKVALHHERTPPIELERASLDALRFPNIGTSPAYLRSSREDRQAILTTAALRRGHRTLDELSAVTTWPVWVVTATVESAQRSGFVDGHMRVTSAGLRLIKHLDKVRIVNALPVTSKELYYPKSLRASK